MKINSAEILCVGTEILIGDIVNTNAAYLSRRLSEIGISQYHEGVVGDNSERLKYYLDICFKNCDLVIMTGGLGPTYDDLTKETVAEYMGRKLVLHKPSEDSIRSYFEKRNVKMTENNLKQAYMPENSVIFPNNCGTAPGAAVEKDGKIVIFLPGPPREMKAMFEESVVPYIERFCEEKLFSININIFGMGESAVEFALKDIIREAKNPSVAPYAVDGECRLRVTARHKSLGVARELCLAMTQRIINTQVGRFIYGFDTTLEEKLVEKLSEKNIKISTAESCTAGLCSGRITKVSGASNVFWGSVVSYDNKIKAKLLNVSNTTLETKGAVSYECAEEMAKGVRELIESDIGVSITGIAGPGGGTEEKPVGTVYIGISSKLGERHIKLTLPNNGREYIRDVSVKNALFEALCEAEKM